MLDYTILSDHTLPPGQYWIDVRLTFGDPEFVPQRAPIIGAPPLQSATGAEWASLLIDAPDNDLAFSIFGVLESPMTATEDLQETIAGLFLDYGTQTSFEAKLRNVLTALAAGDEAAACRALRDFINAVRAQSGKKLSEAAATALIAEATRIQGLIGC